MADKHSATKLSPCVFCGVSPSLRGWSLGPGRFTLVVVSYADLVAKYRRAVKSARSRLDVARTAQVGPATKETSAAGVSDPGASRAVRRR